MQDEHKTKKQLLIELHELRERVAELEKDREERKRAEEELREREERCRDLVEHSRTLICTHDLEGRVLSINAWATELLGYPQEVILRMNIRDMLAPEVRHMFAHYLEELQRHGAAQGLMTVETSTGKRRVWEYNNTLRTEGLAVPIVRGLAHDVTNLRKAEQALRESEERFRLFMDNSPATAWMKDEKGRYVYLSKTFEERHGVRLEDWRGKTDFEVWPLEKAEEFRRTDLTILASGQPTQSVEDTSNPGGGRCYWWKFKFLIRDASRRRYVGGVGLDITQRKQMEEELSRAYDELENRVNERTTELRMLNNQLHREIAEHKHTQEVLMQSEKQLRFLSSRLLEAQEEERRKIARELHDSIGQSLAAVKFNVENLMQPEGIGNSETLAKPLGVLVSIIQGAIEEARRIYTGLRPSILDDLGIRATISWFRREFRNAFPGIHVHEQLEVEEEEIPEPLKIVIFRLIQEALNNVAKYSDAEWVNVILMKAANNLELTIEDNGKGFNLQEVITKNAHEKGFGITGMWERTEFSGGTFLVESKIAGGTTIRAFWPIEM
jgi:PAS domain S-box-containing protein